MRRLIAGLIFALIACDDGGLVGSSTVNGAYALKKVNGAALPYTMSGSGTNKTEIVSDVITLYEGFTYSQSLQTRITVNGQATNNTKPTAGAYSLFGTSITMTPSDGGQRVGIIKANTMTFIEAGVTSVYEK